MEKEKKVITVQIDEEFYDSLMAGGGNSGGSATVDDIMWYLDMYNGAPIFNFTKGTWIPVSYLGEEKPIDDNAKSMLANMITSSMQVAYEFIQTNLNAPQQGKNMWPKYMISRIKMSGTVKSKEDEGFSKKVESFFAQEVYPSYTDSVFWLEEENQSLNEVYGSSYYLTDVKISAPNGIEIELPNK